MLKIRDLESGVSDDEEADFVFFREPGPDLAENMKTLYSRGVNHGAGELTANGWDADSPRIVMDFDFDKSTFNIVDFGRGMDDLGLESFYRLGGSEKKIEEGMKVRRGKSPGGRRFMGMFGVGSIVIPALCREYTLETVQNGRGIRVVEEFGDERLRQDRPIPGKRFDASGRPNGTSIFMRDLRFSEGVDFSLAGLKKFIPLKFPILPDFEVIINGEKLKSRGVGSSRRFKVNYEGDHCGKVEGVIHLVETKVPSVGLHVYVNEQGIGDADVRLIRLAPKKNLQGRVVGFINANGLEDAVLVDKGGFVDKHPGVQELEDHLRWVLGKVRKYNDARSIQKRVKIIEERKDNLANNVRQRLAAVGINPMRRKESLVLESMGKRTLGRYDPGTDKLYLNQDHPSIRPHPSATPQDIQESMMHAVLDVLAEYHSKGDHGRFNDLREKYWEALRGTLEGTLPEGPDINEGMIYTLGQLAELSRHSRKTLLDSLVFDLLEGNPEEIVGEDYLKFERSLVGMVSLYDLLGSKIDIMELPAKHNHAERFLEQAGRSAHPFAYGMKGKEGRKGLFFVESTCAHHVYDILFDGDSSDLRKKNIRPDLIFQELGSRFMTLSELGNFLQDVAPEEIVQIASKVHEYADKNERFGLVTHRQGNGEHYQLGQFVSIMQLYRGNPVKPISGNGNGSAK